MNKVNLLELYASMKRIRVFEDTIHDLVEKDEFEGYVHCYAGQEAVAVGVISQLSENDFLTSTYRNHGHSIARGVDLKSIAAEIYGKRSGVCKGKGGSMHTVDQNKGMIAGFGIVAAGLPVAAGAAFAGVYKGTGQVAATFFGDGAIHQGAFHEGMYLASLWDLPVLFVNENNGYAESTALEYHLIPDTIADLAKNYKMAARTIDGMDLFEVHKAVEEALAHLRSGQGPYFLECKTYRYYGQFEGDKQTYKPAEEVAAFRARDPLKLFRERALNEGFIKPEELDRIDAEIEREVAEAIEFGRSEPYPDISEVYTDVYSDAY